MGYYMSGGYYRAGGYYRGGFFSSLGKVAGKVAGAAQALAPIATMVNPALGMGMSSIGGIGTALFAGAGKTASPGVPIQQTGAVLTGKPGGGAITTPTLDFLTGLAGKLGSGLTGPTGQPLGKGGLVELPGGAVVAVRSRRRMNPLNPRALSRAYRRLNSASKWAHRLFNVSKPRHGVKPKFGRRRSR